VSRPFKEMVVKAEVALIRGRALTMGVRKGLSGPSTTSKRKVNTAYPFGVIALFLCTTCIVIGLLPVNKLFSAGV